MKKRFVTGWLIAFMVVTTCYTQTTPPYQDPKYGPDSASRITCAGNLSTVDGFMKIDLIERAIPAWKEAFCECPQASINTYIYGVKIMRYLIEKEADDNKKEALIDTLMLIYDTRIEYFGQKGKVLGQKGMDLLRYQPGKLEEAYKYFSESVKMQKDKSDDAVLLNFMKTTALLYKKENIDAAEVLDNYVFITDNLNKKLRDSKNSDRTKLVQENVQMILVRSGAANCTKIIEIFTPRYEKNPKDADLLKTITSLLQAIECEDAQLYANASENLYSIEPSAQAAYNLAKLFVKREEYKKAAKYYKEAIEKENDDARKAEYYYQLGVLNSTKLELQAQARNCAYEALKLKQDWGMPYLLIGSAYASSSNSCGSNKFEKATVYWAAVDKFIKAKSIDPTIEAEADKYIAQYSRYFPCNEDAFFYGYSDGQSYTVGCWINESTKVRTIKK